VARPQGGLGGPAGGCRLAARTAYRYDPIAVS